MYIKLEDALSIIKRLPIEYEVDMKDDLSSLPTINPVEVLENMIEDYEKKPTYIYGRRAGKLALKKAIEKLK